MEKQPGFQFQSIILLDSQFSREPEIDFEAETRTDVSINSHFTENEVGILCFLELEFSLVSKLISIVNCKCKFGGVFKVIGKSNLDVKTFGNVNGPSIMFPFLREHLASLSVKAGINPILLPPVNFVTLNEQKLKL